MAIARAMIFQPYDAPDLSNMLLCAFMLPSLASSFSESFIHTGYFSCHAHICFIACWMLISFYLPLVEVAHFLPRQFSSRFTELRHYFHARRAALFLFHFGLMTTKQNYSYLYESFISHASPMLTT